MKCGVSDAGLRGRSGNGPGRSVPPSSPFRSWRWIIRRSRYGLLPSAPGVDRNLVDVDQVEDGAGENNAGELGAGQCCFVLGGSVWLAATRR